MGTSKNAPEGVSLLFSGGEWVQARNSFERYVVPPLGGLDADVLVVGGGTAGTIAAILVRPSLER